MGRVYSHQVSQERPTEKECCGCRSWSWILYLLVLLALALAILNFWMSLYRHEELRHSIEDLRTDLTKVSTNLNTTMEGLQLIRNDHENLRSDTNAEIAKLTIEFKNAKKSNHHHQRPRGGSDPDSEESKEMTLIKEIKNAHGQLIDGLVRKVLGYDSVNTNTMEAVNRIQKNLESLEESSKVTQGSMETLQRESSKQQDEIKIQKDNFSKWNVTLHEMRLVVDRLSTDLDVLRAQTRITDDEVSGLTQLTSALEEDMVLRDVSALKRVERAEQRLDDLERSEMDMKSDIRRLNKTAEFVNNLPLQPDTQVDNSQEMVMNEIIALNSSLQQKMEQYLTPSGLKQTFVEDLDAIQNRLLVLETTVSFQWQNLNETLAIHNHEVSDRLAGLERQLIDSRGTDRTLEEKLDKVDTSLKYLGQNLMKMKNLPNELKNLENRINRIQTVVSSNARKR